jgi:hypothetical protein
MLDRRQGRIGNNRLDVLLAVANYAQNSKSQTDMVNRAIANYGQNSKSQTNMVNRDICLMLLYEASCMVDRLIYLMLLYVAS